MHHFKKECVTQSTEAGVWPQTRFGIEIPREKCGRKGRSGKGRRKI